MHALVVNRPPLSARNSKLISRTRTNDSMKRTIPPAIVEDRERDREAEKCRTKIREKRKRERKDERTNGNQFSGRMRRRGAARTRRTQIPTGSNCISSTPEERERGRHSDRLPDEQRVTGGKGRGTEEGDTIDSQSQ